MCLQRTEVFFVKIIFTLFIFVLTSCGGPTYVDFFPYRDDGTLKPKVVFLPVNALNKEDDAFACYFDDAIRYYAMDSGGLYLYSQEEVSAWSAKSGGRVEGYRPAEFVVQVECVENAVLPYTNQLNNCIIPTQSNYQCARNVVLRLKITDIRCQKPRVILYELLEKSQVASTKETAKTKRIAESLYDKIAKQASDRIEEVILCTK